MIPLDTILKPYGKLGMVGCLSGERYYWFVDNFGGVSMMPASVVEPMYAETLPPIDIDPQGNGV